MLLNSAEQRIHAAHRIIHRAEKGKKNKQTTVTLEKCEDAIDTTTSSSTTTTAVGKPADYMRGKLQCAGFYQSGAHREPRQHNMKILQ